MKNEIKLGIGIFLFIFILSLFTIVPQSKRGIRVILGKAQQELVQPGLSMKLPFINSVKKISIQPQKIEFEIKVGADGSITKDNQTVGNSFVIFYVYKEDKLVNMYSNYGTHKVSEQLEKNIISSIKEIIGTYTIFDIAMNKKEIREKTFALVKDRVNALPIDITQFEITNYDWSDEFDKQIETTMKRAQQVKQKEQEVLIAEQDAQKKVKQAEAEKEALIKTAEGEKEAAKLNAEAMALNGEGIRKYNQEIVKSEELEIHFRQLEIEKIKAEKWNGVYVPEQVWTATPINFGGGLLGK